MPVPSCKSAPNGCVKVDVDDINRRRGLTDGFRERVLSPVSLLTYSKVPSVRYLSSADLSCITAIIYAARRNLRGHKQCPIVTRSTVAHFRAHCFDFRTRERFAEQRTTTKQINQVSNCDDFVSISTQPIKKQNLTNYFETEDRNRFSYLSRLSSNFLVSLFL